MTTLKCRFGCDDPIGVFHVPAGCACWRDPIQALCAQHFYKIETTEEVTCLINLTEKK